MPISPRPARASAGGSSTRPSTSSSFCPGRGSLVIYKVAHQLAASFPVEHLAVQAREALEHSPIWAELHSRAQVACSQAASLLAECHLPDMPSFEEVRLYAQVRLVRTPSLDVVAERTHQVLLELVSA